MKLRNKKTGEIGYLLVGKGSDHYVVTNDDWEDCGKYNSLAELCEDWEDYEEPKTFWAISWAGEPEEYDAKNTPEELKNMAKQIGNYFSSREEAERAVEKLKAWKRLRDKGFFFDGRTPVHDNTVRIRARVGVPFLTDELTNDLDLLFGGEE